MNKYLVISVCLGLTAITLPVFWQVRNFDFVNYDDNVYVYENMHVSNGLTLDGIIWAFTTGCQGNWHPVTWLSLMLDCQLFGVTPGRMHLVNVFLHLVNTLLLFTVLRKMTGSLWASAFVAAAFALHPMHVESVVWIAERKDVLSTVFWLLAMLAYARYVQSPKIAYYLLTLSIFALGLMAKPMLVTLPCVLLLVDYWPLNRIVPQRITWSGCRRRKSDPVLNNTPSLYGIIIEKIPFFVLSVMSCVVTFLVQRGGGAVAGISDIPLQNRIANAFFSYAVYIGKIVWPLNLAVLYPFEPRFILSGQVILCILLLLIVSIVVFRYGRTFQYLPVGWFWFLVTLIPVIGIIQAGAQSFADRYTYIPYIGLFVMIAWGFPDLLLKWPYRKITLGIAAVTVLTAMGTGTLRQVSYWKGSFTLFTHAVEVTQNNDIAYNNRGDAYGKQGRWQEAIEDFSRAIRIKPDYAEAYSNRGVAHYNLGRWQEATEDFIHAIKIKPNLANAYSNLAVVMQTQGDYGRAIENFTLAVQLQPDALKPRSALAYVLILNGKFNDAAEQLRQILSLWPQTPAALNNLALLMVKHPELKNRDLDEAVRLADRACELTNYRNAAFLDNLAMAYSSAGRFPEAGKTAQAVLEIDPNMASAHRILGAVFSSEGAFKKAVIHINRSLEIEPNNIGAKNNLAWILATSPDPNIQNPSDAIRLAQEVCKSTRLEDPAMLDTLAAAYASDGRFLHAVETAQKAIDLADQADQADIKKDIEQRLNFYKQNKPYFESGDGTGYQ